MNAHLHSVKIHRTWTLLALVLVGNTLVGCGTIKEMTSTALHDLRDLRSPTQLGALPNQTHTGTLSFSDQQLSSHEFSDEYRIYARTGQILLVEMRAFAFDPYVIVIAPSGYQLENDEHMNSQITAAIEWELTEEGEYRIIATSDEAGKRGRYTLEISLIDP